MTHTICHMSISVDGFVAGPRQDRDNPVGVGGLQLHQWQWHAGEPGHEADARPRDELITRDGAYVMGRSMFGPIRGDWDTEGFDAALQRARQAAGERDVDIDGGASTVQQALAAGAIDEHVLDVVPVLLGTGERLLYNVEDPGLEPIETIHSPYATHIRCCVGG